MSTVIQIENLSKRYRIKSASQQGYVNLKEVITDQLSRLVRRGRNGPASSDLWALRDVNLEIHSGELIGLVGRNGSGKSTLLKLLAQVTKPTTGRIRLWGRIGSLLEVGTGFHPELTGRENIFLSGSILGMSWGEVSKKFDEIVAFSEMGEFLNMPVKRYSNGMYMRLAFSVAAHLDPDILLIDEALSVGDINFRKKCLEKMQSFVQQGATVIFVSHSMTTVSEACNRCLLLEKGLLIEDGPASAVVSKYLHRDGAQDIIRFEPVPSATGAVFRELRINEGKPVIYGQPFVVEFTLETSAPRGQIFLSFGFSSMEGARVLSCNLDTRDRSVVLARPGAYTFRVSLPSLDLSPGLYVLDLDLRDEQHRVLDHRPGCAQIEVLSDRNLPDALMPEGGGVHRACAWEMK